MSTANQQPNPSAEIAARLRAEAQHIDGGWAKFVDGGWLTGHVDTDLLREAAALLEWHAAR